MAKYATFDTRRYFSDIGGWLIALFIIILIHSATLLSVNLYVPHTTKTDHPARITTIEWITQKASAKPLSLTQKTHKNNVIQEEQQHQQQQAASKKMALAKPDNPPKSPARSQDATNKPRPSKPKKTYPSQQTPEKSIATPAKSAILKATEVETKPSITAETLQQQIAQLGSEIRLNQQGPEQTKIKFANQLSSHKFVASQYITDLKNKVKQAAENSSLNEIAKQQSSATLSLDVGINTEGRIYSIRTSKSSGNWALDDAAKRIVKISAPFPPLPLELSKGLRVLVIPITWYFTEQTGMTAR